MSSISVGVKDLENNNNPTRKDEKWPKSSEKKIAKQPKSNEISLDLARSRPFSARSRLDLVKSHWI